MPRPEKVARVQEIADRLRRAQAVVAADYRGLNVKSMSELRSQLRAAGVEVKVVKNTLARRASDEAQVEGLKSFLEGPTMLAFGYDEPTAPARILSQFSRQHQELQIKGGILNGAAMDVAGVMRLATLPGREELLAMALRALQGPIAGLVYALSGVPRSLVYALDALRRQREAG